MTNPYLFVPGLLLIGILPGMLASYQQGSVTSDPESIARIEDSSPRHQGAVRASDHLAAQREQIDNLQAQVQLLLSRIEALETEQIESTEPVKEIVSPTLNNTTKAIYALEQTGSLIERIAHHFRENYMDTRDILDKEYSHMTKYYVDQYAAHSNAKKAIDERGKWGDYEKIMSKFLMETGETTARMAELLNYSSKYGSIGIDRHGEFVDEQTKRFKKELLEFLMVCPMCAKNIYHKINEEIEKYRKGVELEIRVAI